MAKRRANKEGTIYKRTNGKWRAQIILNGARKSFTGNSQRECQEWIKEFRLQHPSGQYSSYGKVRLFRLFHIWISTIRHSRARNTIFNYEWIMKKRIIPIIGNYELENLSSETIQNFYGGLLETGLSNHAVHVTHKVLNSCLEYASKAGMIQSNPCKATIPPKPAKSEMKILDEDQLKVFLAAAHDYDDQYFAVYYLAIHTGMRMGELIGLKWPDINWDKRFLGVKRQLIRVRGEGFSFTETKTRSGRRTVILGEKAIGVLKTQLSVAQKKKETAKGNWQEYNLVFPTRVGTPIFDSNLRRGYRNTLKWAGLPKLRFHDLRHTAASLMLNNGIPLLVVSKRLGHSKPSITLDVYGHLLPSKQQEAAKLMDELLDI